MAVQKAARAPYASTGSIISVIEKHRQVGLQTMSLQRLPQIGVSEALAPRTMRTLAFLGFYDENGKVTPEFDSLRKAPDHDFKPRLAALLREAYAPILEVLDPATATPLEVENAFRGFEPTGQLPRMVQLFMGLMIYADIMPEDRRTAGVGVRQPGARTGAGATGKKGEAARGSRPHKPASETRHETPQPPGNSHGADFTQAGGNTFVLLMPSGPEMTLTVKMDVMRTSVEDRNFIFKIVDELREFADRHQASGAKSAGMDGQAAEVSP